MKVEELLKVKAKIKAKKPDFVRQDYGKIKRLSKRWCKPKGVHSKMRHNKAGNPRNVRTGWRSPSLVRGLHKSGKAFVMVRNVDDVKDIDPKSAIIIISGRTGLKNRMVIIEAAVARGISISDVADPRKYLEELKRNAEEKKKIKEFREKKKAKAKEAKPKETPEGKPEKSIEEKVETEEERAEREKRELDKVLTKRS